MESLFIKCGSKEHINEQSGKSPDNVITHQYSASSIPSIDIKCSEFNLETHFNLICSRPDEIFSAIEANKSYLENIILDPIAVVTTEQALKDFNREKVLLNGVPFVPDMSYATYFPRTLRLLIHRLVRQLTPPVVQPIESKSLFDTKTELENMYNIILQRASRTSSGSDSFYKAQTMFRVEGMFLAQYSSKNDPPVKIDLFISNRCICAKIEVRNTYALYNEDQLCEIVDSNCRPVPWMLIDTVVFDESNLQTGHHCRKMNITVANPRRKTKTAHSRKISSGFFFLPSFQEFAQQKSI